MDASGHPRMTTKGSIDRTLLWLRILRYQGKARSGIAFANGNFDPSAISTPKAVGLACVTPRVQSFILRANRLPERLVASAS
jgi:hypothetical protein